jgi:hypothetical protein
MKLTKGKISKLYNKKKQSLKKVKKNGKKNSKKKTFRRKRGFNLANKSLKKSNYKKVRGGAENTDSKENTDTNGNPKDDDISQANSLEKKTNEVTPVEETSSALEEANKETVTAAATTADTAAETPDAAAAADDAAETPAAAAAADDATETPAADDAATADAEKPQQVEEPPQQSVTDISQSLTNVVDYISNKIAEKVSQQVSSGQSEENIQNGFNSVNAAAVTMALGGKKRKTRRFKLTNKNKTKHMV